MKIRCVWTDERGEHSEMVETSSGTMSLPHIGETVFLEDQEFVVKDVQYSISYLGSGKYSTLFFRGMVLEKKEQK